jgi:hypothetical protein
MRETSCDLAWHLRARRHLSRGEVRALHLEHSVSEQCATGSAAPIIEFAAGETGEFSGVQLGMRWGEESFLDVQQDLRSTNREALDALERDQKNKITQIVADIRKYHDALVPRSEHATRRRDWVPTRRAEALYNQTCRRRRRAPKASGPRRAAAELREKLA